MLGGCATGNDLFDPLRLGIDQQLTRDAEGMGDLPMSTGGDDD